MVGHGGGSAGSYLADPTSPIPSHCASIVVTSTLRVKYVSLAKCVKRMLSVAGNILLLLFDDNPTLGSANGNSMFQQNGREPPSSVYELTENNPELRMLNEKCRVHTVYGGKQKRFTQDDEDVIRLWIQGCCFIN